MKFTTRYIQLPSILFIFTFFFSACTILAPRVSERPKDLISLEAEKTISTLKNQNLKLKTFKGVGNIKFRGSKKKDVSGRIAWVASAPDRIRISLSSVSGQLMISVASDGQWLYLISHSSGDFYKKPATASSMRRLFTIPVKTEDMVDILAGRVPIHSYDSAVLTDNRSQVYSTEGHTVSTRNGSEDSGQNGYVLVLKKKWGTLSRKYTLMKRKKMFIRSKCLTQPAPLHIGLNLIECGRQTGIGFHLDCWFQTAMARVFIWMWIDTGPTRLSPRPCLF